MVHIHEFFVLYVLKIFFFLDRVFILRIQSLLKFKEPTMYGNEKSRKTPSSLFNKEVAMKALNDAKFYLENILNSLNS